jgi:hypothetical protein
MIEGERETTLPKRVAVEGYDSARSNNDALGQRERRIQEWRLGHRAESGLTRRDWIDRLGASSLRCCLR